MRIAKCCLIAVGVDGRGTIADAAATWRRRVRTGDATTPEFGAESA